MAASLGMLVLLVGCHKDDAEPENPFDDWGPYKGCEQDIVYTAYDVTTRDGAAYPDGEEVYVYTAQGGLLERDYYYDADDDGTRIANDATYCSYDEKTHAPFACSTFFDPDGKPDLYETVSYGYRADGLIAWESDDFFGGELVYISSWTRDESDRVVRIDLDRGDPYNDIYIDGIPDSSDMWTYDGDDTTPSELDRYTDGIVDDDHLELSVHYVVENDLAVHAELANFKGKVYEVHDYTYDDDGNLLTDVRDGGWEITTYTYDDRGFWLTGTHQVAWKELSDVRTDETAEVTYDCEDP